MKKIILSLVIMFTLALTANAQFYAGASVGAHAQKGEYSLAFSPEVGYSFQGNTGAGCLFDFGFAKDNTFDIGEFTFGVNPYFEYRLLEIDKFTFYLHTYLHYNMTTLTGAPVDVNPEQNYGVSLHPGVIWGVTDHWSVAFYLGGLEYMYNQPSGVAFKDGTGEFNLGLATYMPAGLALYYGF